MIRRAADVLGYPLDTVIQLSIPEGSQSSLAVPFSSEQPLPHLTYLSESATLVCCLLTQMFILFLHAVL